MKSRKRGSALCFIAFLFWQGLSHADWIQTNGPCGGTVYVFTKHNSNLFVGTIRGVYLSTDEGSTWTVANTGIEDKEIYSLAANDSTVFAGTVNGGVYRSTDNGASWEQTSDGFKVKNITIYGLAVIGSNLFAGTNGDGLYRSTDNGDHWTKRLAAPQVGAVIEKDSKLFVGTGGQGVFYSTDNGDNWTRASNGLTDQNIYRLAVSG
jgi:ligand-binding sensor domain-containing protein